MASQEVRSWQISAPSLESVLGEFPRPLDALASGAIPAIVLRGVYPVDACRRLIGRLIRDELLYDPSQPMPDQFREASIPEGYYREGRGSHAKHAWREPTGAAERSRIDIGTSLGYRGSDQQAFFAHAQQTIALFEQLFRDQIRPIDVVYEHLRQLSVDKRVSTARQPDGRQYGPAIIRAHYGGYAYQPHFDSVRLREKRTDYAVHDFDHQFAGVLVLQNTQRGDRSAQCILHRCPWQPEIDPYLKAGRFHDYAHDNQIPHVQVVLEPGDLYFFNTRMIHEVPGVDGDSPRIVLATFIGYSADREEVFVWS